MEVEAFVVVLEDTTDPAQERALADAFRAGDAAAFDTVFHRYQDRVYHVLYRFTGNHEDALDLAQEVFVRAYRNSSQFQGTAQISTWLFSIAANLGRNRLRDRTRKGRNKGQSLEALQVAAPGVADTAMLSGATPREHAERQELDAALQGCLEDLPALYRMAFALRSFDGMSYEEIAVAVGCPKGTVKSRLNQARVRLAECLQGRGVLESGT